MANAPFSPLILLAEAMEMGEIIVGKRIS